MDTRLLSIALAAFLTTPVFAAEPSSVATPVAETRKVIFSPTESPEEIRRKLREAGIPDDKIEEILAKVKAGPMRHMASASSPGTATAASSPSSAPSETGAATPGKTTATTLARQPELNTAELDAKALESKDPALEALKKSIEALRQEKSLLEAEIALAETKRRNGLFPLVQERSKIEGERAMLTVRESAKDADAEAEKVRLERDLAKASADASAKLVEKTNRMRDLESQARMMKARAEAEQTASSTRLSLIKAREEASRVVETKREYPLDPLKDGVLSISDRRIPFNGIVSEDLADFVTERIAFYNNADSTKPIFIVIDSSPGGSVMAGYRILSSMKSSKAPVYVVVKQFAASMAAITTTSAVRSFCYPGTIILHHQMSTGFRGNMRSLKENMAFTDDLSERIFRPVYTKIGYKDSRTFVDDMYKHFNSGDWLAFGDEAVKMRWATDTVTQIRETSIRENPAGDAVGVGMGGPMAQFVTQGCELKRDENGKAYYKLPMLTTPGDVWDLHDPQGTFRVN